MGGCAYILHKGLEHLQILVSGCLEPILLGYWEMAILVSMYLLYTTKKKIIDAKGSVIITDINGK